MTASEDQRGIWVRKVHDLAGTSAICLPRAWANRAGLRNLPGERVIFTRLDDKTVKVRILEVLE